jgi:hypothetical protein
MAKRKSIASASNRNESPQDERRSRDQRFANLCALAFALAMIALAAYTIHRGYPYLAGAFGALGSSVWALEVWLGRPAT